MQDYSSDKPSFWGAMAVPWEGTNPLKVGAMSFALTCCILGVVFLIMRLAVHSERPIPSPLFLLPVIISVAIPSFTLPVRLLTGRLANRLEGDPLLRADCMIVHGFVEKPGIAAIFGNELLIKPIVGEEIRVDLSRIAEVSELRWYNGRPYVGTARFFKLTVPQDVSAAWRLGFGVANAEPWRRVLPISR